MPIPADDPVWKAALAAPLASKDDWPTPELLAEMERDLEDVRAGRAQTFTSGEVAAILVRRVREEGAVLDGPEDEERHRDLVRRVAEECAARGLTEEGLHAAIAEKERFNEGAKAEP